MKENRRGKRWTPEENDTLAMLCHDGVSLYRASVVLKRTKVAVLLQAAKLGYAISRFKVRARGRKHMQDDLPLFNEHGRTIKSGDVSEVDGRMTTISVTATDDPFKRNPSKRIPFSQRVEKQKAGYRKKMLGWAVVLMQISVIFMGITNLLAYYGEDGKLFRNILLPFFLMTIIAMLAMHMERKMANDK